MLPLLNDDEKRNKFSSLPASLSLSYFLTLTYSHPNGKKLSLMFVLVDFFVGFRFASQHVDWGKAQNVMMMLWQSQALFLMKILHFCRRFYAIKVLLFDKTSFFVAQLEQNTKKLIV